MIIIKNLSLKGSKTCRYQVRINNQEIFRFKHVRGSLARCFRDAARAAAVWEKEQEEE